ncbi:MAG: phosphatase PAP2 family protein [Chloroflexi bacterium]|nr:phosphatase PAP2 family protein [Chloroflexota bacterium]MBU1751876.1 phosphatase PAP2 family protein [Chloroflexota bacterium]MBU1880349.1 phosphatase PAP2 family protein [Chloroflexota bacterium]
MNQIDIIIWIQSWANPALDAVFGLITQTASEEFFLIALPIILWCYDMLVGTRLVVIFLLSAYANGVIKDLVQTQRPYLVDPRVRVLMEETGGGYAWPSGHTQNATVFWFLIAAQFRRWRIAVWGIAIVAVALVGLSRIYLGLHWPQDVVGGFLVGVVVVLVAGVGLRAWDRQGWAIPLWLGIAISVLGPLALVVVSPLFVTPGTMETAARTLGVVAGLGLGYALERRYLGFCPRGVAWWKHLLKILIGLGGILILRLALKPILGLVLPPDAEAFLRYGIIGFWSGLGAPAVFVLLRLAPRQR